MSITSIDDKMNASLKYSVENVNYSFELRFTDCVGNCGSLTAKAIVRTHRSDTDVVVTHIIVAAEIIAALLTIVLCRTRRNGLPDNL